MSDVIARMEFAQQEIDRVFGEGYAAHSELVVAVLQVATTDRAATLVATAMRSIAESLLVEDEEPPRIVQPRQWAAAGLHQRASSQYQFDPLCAVDTTQRIAELEQEMERLERTEEAIVVATGAPRERGCPPWVVLGHSPGGEMVGVDPARVLLCPSQSSTMRSMRASPIQS